MTPPRSASCKLPSPPWAPRSCGGARTSTVLRLRNPTGPTPGDGPASPTRRANSTSNSRPPAPPSARR
eukprot:5750327-Lingulodinium_polyedra.AAC.1